MDLTLDTVGAGGECPACGHDQTAIKRAFARKQCATYYRDIDGWGDVVGCYCRDEYHSHLVNLFNERPEIEA
ncbi:hypothetical protein QL996_07645 [Planococcus sp. APC 4015]|nr:hypothetical protein [Planococcus sp. APC 4015]